MSTKQQLAEIDRGINALQKARALCLKSAAVVPKAKATAATTAKVTRVSVKNAANSPWCKSVRQLSPVAASKNVSLQGDHNLPEGILNGFDSLITRSTLAYHPCGAYSSPWR